jgi:hypothetical protein
MTRDYTAVTLRLCLAFAAAALAPRAADAQISSVGTSTELAQFFVRGVDGAYDPRNDTYLMVGAAGPVIGVCVGPDGHAQGAPITIKPADSAYGAFPRAQYSPDIDNGNGGFLVVWSVELGPGIVVMHSRIVSCTSGLLGTEQSVSGIVSSWQESGPALAYSTTSRRFLVAWKTYTPTLVVRLIDNNGAPIGDIVQVSAGFGRDPGVAWNPTTDEFGVSFSGENATAYSAFVRVPANNPAAFTRTTFNVVGGVLTTITDLVFNTVTNRYVMAWYETTTAVRVAEIDGDGTVLAQRLVSSRIGSYDALSLAFNPVTGTMLLVGLDRATDAVLAAELDGHGVPVQASESTISTSAPPARYTRVVSSTTTRTWNANWSGRGFNAMTDQIVKSDTAGPAPASTPLLAVDTPVTETSVDRGLYMAGWALDRGSPADSTGVDAIHVWAFPRDGSAARFLGVAHYGYPRADVAAALGNSRFTNVGYALYATFDQPGTYDVIVYAHSTVTQTFNAAKAVTVHVTGSMPFMWIDVPVTGTSTGTQVYIAGWALDFASPSSTGVDAVHIWAYPVGGGAPQWLGFGTLGQARPDVGAVFGSARFNNAGFSAIVSMPHGDYDVVVYTHSAVSGTFNNAQVVRLHVN